MAAANKQHPKHALYCWRYEKTPKGFLMRTYCNMQKRVRGQIPRGVHRYLGLELLARSEFYEWALSDPSFQNLFAVWERSGYDRKLAPSIDRINTELGYTLDNMRWLTHSENSRRGGLFRQGQAILD